MLKEETTNKKVQKKEKQFGIRFYRFRKGILQVPQKYIVKDFEEYYGPNNKCKNNTIYV